MKTHSVRNKASSQPIFTLSPVFWGHLKTQCYPETVSLVVRWFQAEYLRLTGKKPILDHAQLSDFCEWVGADDRGMWTSRFVGKPVAVYQATRVFEEGLLRQQGETLDSVAEIVQAFYSAIEKTYP